MAGTRAAQADAGLLRLAVRLLVWLCGGLLALFGVELLLELWRSDVPWSELAATSHRGQALASTVSRAINNLTAMVLTFIALAVPLTANMYTPKLIEIFVRDRVNLGAMLYFAAMGAHAVFCQAFMYEQWAPTLLYTVLWVSGVVGFAVLIPYYVYVLHFLNPTTIVGRVTDMIVREFEEIRAGRRTMPVARARLDQLILNLGNVILRAADRADRDVTLHAIYGLQSAVTRYSEVVDDLPPEWFGVEPALFPGASREALGFIVRERTWVEHKCLHQLLLAFTASLAKMPDAVSAISAVSRRVATHALRRDNDRVLGLCIRFFNTFLREAIKRRDTHAITDVFGQYTFLAMELCATRPERTLAVARHFKYYAEFARWQGMPFVFELVANDLREIVERAYAAGASAEPLLDLFLTFRAEKASARLPKSQAHLAAWLAQHGHAEEAARVARALAAAGPEQLQAAREQLQDAEDPMFWEVTQSQRNLDYLEPRLRAEVLRVLDEALAARGGAGDQPTR